MKPLLLIPAFSVLLSAGLPEAKTLLTQAEVEQATGAKVLSAAPVPYSQGFATSWQFMRADKYVKTGLPLAALWVGDAAFGKKSRASMGKMKTEKVAGLGREAFWAPDFGTLTIYRADDTVLQVATYLGKDKAALKAQAEKLAKLALARM